MKEMKQYTIAEVCSRLSSGKGIPASKVTPTGPYPVIGGNGVRGYTDSFNFDGECAIIGRQGANCGNVRYFQGKAYMTEHAIVAIANENANTKYLACLFSLMHLGNLSAQSAQPGLSVQTLSKQIVYLPEISKQNQIANIIKALDTKIEINKQINDNLEQQASFLFQDWLSNCNSNVSIRELAENVLDYTQNKCEQVYLLNSSDVTEGRFSSLPLVSNTNLKGQFKKRFKKGDILYSEIRPRNRHYAYCYFDADRYIASTRLIILRAKPDMLTSSTVLYQYLMLNSVFEEFTLKTESRSGTFPQGNYEDLSSIRVPYSANQEEIAKSLEAIYEQLWNNLKENERLEALRDSLLPKLMSGELKINNLDC